MIALAMVLLANGGQPMVTRLLRPMITLYGKDGLRIRAAPKWEIGRGIAIVDTNSHHEIGIAFHGDPGDPKVVYLRPSEVVTENYVDGCTLVDSSAQDARTHSAVSGGIQNGMGKTEMSCK